MDFRQGIRYTVWYRIGLPCIKGGCKMTSQKYTILYGRLSQDDGKNAESNSITNQRLMLEKYARDNGFDNVLFLADDGYTGTNFDEVR
jgi:hypothetical protein